MNPTRCTILISAITLALIITDILFPRAMAAPNPMAETAPPTFAIYIVPLKHRPAESLLGTLQPLVTSGGSISVHKNTLIINTNATNLAQLQSLIDELDQPLRQLVLTVTDKLHPDQSQHFDQKISQKRQYTRRSTGHLNHKNTTALHVLEGHSAYLVQTSNTFPIVVYGEQDDHLYKTYLNEENTNSIVATPWLQGDNVTINLERTFTHQQKQMQTQSTVTGKLGQWITVVDLEADREIPLGAIDTRRVKRRSGVFVKIELADHATP